MKKTLKTPVIPEDEDFLEINKMELDQEWLNQPKLFHKWSRRFAKAVEQVEVKDSQLKLVKAQLVKDITENPDKYDCRKTTKDQIESVVIVQPAYQEAVAASIKATYNHALLKGTVESLNQRKTALENLVKLHGQDYFSEPVAEGDDRERLDNVKKKSIRSRGRE